MAGIYGAFTYGSDVYSGYIVLDAFNYEHGSFEGRIAPVNVDPIDGPHLYCLGSDKQPDSWHDIAYGDKVEIEQSVDLTDINFVRATWRIRQPEAMPETTAITNPAVMIGDVLHYVDPTKPTGDSLMAVVSSADVFTMNDTHRIIRIAGATNGGNNGDKRITGIASARVAIVDSGIVADENPLGGGTGTATLVGARWKASLIVASTERAWTIEYPSRDVLRLDLQAHVSKLSGAQNVKFRLALVEQT